MNGPPVALVTGAAGGIGAATVSALIAAGYRVVAADLTPADLTPADIPTADVVHAHLDVTDERDVERLVRWVEEEVGPVEVLVNAAGVLRTDPTTTSSLTDWQTMFAVNATGVYLVSREVARSMVARGRGAVITVASNAAGVPRASMAGYAASKAAAASFTRSLGLEVAPHGVRCNVVSPGSTRTPMLAALAGSPGTEGHTLVLDDHAQARIVAGAPQDFKLGIPLGRLAEPGDVAAAVVFLASDAARHITLHDLVVDGGATLR